MRSNISSCWFMYFVWLVLCWMNKFMNPLVSVWVKIDIFNRPARFITVWIACWVRYSKQHKKGYAMNSNIALSFISIHNLTSLIDGNFEFWRWRSGICPADPLHTYGCHTAYIDERPGWTMLSDVVPLN